MIYRNMQTFALKVLQKCRSWATRNRAVQMFLLTPNRNIFSGKFLSQKWFSLCCGSILFSASSELRFVKWVSLLEKNYIVKMSDIYRQFLLAFRVSVRKSDIKNNADDVNWNTHKKVVCPRYSFQKKKNSKQKILNH